MPSVTTILPAVTPVAAAVTGVRDPGSTRVVYAVVIGLALLGLAMVALTVWLVRATRPDPELLAPLEAIQSRRWRRLDPAGRRRLLDEVRPRDADPVDRAPAVPRPDAEFVEAPPERDVRELSESRAVETAGTERTDDDGAVQDDGTHHDADIDTSGPDHADTDGPGPGDSGPADFGSGDDDTGADRGHVRRRDPNDAALDAHGPVDDPRHGDDDDHTPVNGEHRSELDGVRTSHRTAGTDWDDWDETLGLGGDPVDRPGSGTTP